MYDLLHIELLIGSLKYYLQIAVIKFQSASKDSVRTLLTLGAFPSCKNVAGQTALEVTNNADIIAIFNEQMLHSIANGRFDI